MSSVNFLRTFRDNLPVTSSKAKDLYKLPVYEKRTAPIWVITQWVVLISYGRFGKTFRSHLQGSRLIPNYCIWEENCALLCHYALSSGNFLRTFRDNLSAPSSRVRNCFLLDSGPLKMVRIYCPETSVINYQYSLRNDPEERSSRLLRCGSLKPRKI